MRLRSLDRRVSPAGAEQLLVSGLVAAAGAALWRRSATPHQGLALAVAALLLLGLLLLVLHDLERYVLVVVFCSMVFPQSLASPGGSHVALSDLLLLLALACWLAWFAVRREPVAWLRGNRYLPPALAFAGITLASVLWSTNWLFSVKQSVQILELVVVVPVLFASVPTSLDRIRQALVAFVVFASGLAVVVFSFFIGRVAKGDLSPEYLPGMHKNATGGFIGVAIVLTYGLLLERRPGTRWLAALLPLELAGLFGTISRGAMVGTAVALLLVTLLVGRRRLPTIAFVAAVTAAFLVTIQSSLPAGGYSSVATRPESYAGGVRWIEAHPLFGTGAGTYNDYLPKAHIGLTDPNNLFLLTWAELGIFGLLLLLLLLVRVGRTVAEVRAMPSPAATLGCTVAAAACSNLVHWQFDTTWARGTATITFALVGLVYAIARLAPPPAPVAAAAPEPRAVAAPPAEPRRYLRVLQVVASADFGGLERNVVELARGLRGRGVDCRIACPFDARALRAAAAHAGVPVAPAAGRGPWLPHVVGLLDANPPELVHAHDAPGAVAGAELAEAIGSAFVRTHRSQGAADLDADWRGRTVETLPVAVELPSPERVARRAEDAAALGRPAAVLLGGTAGRSADLVVLALARLRLRVPRFRLVVAGPDDPALRAFAEELAVADAIEWVGPLRRGADVFRRADLVVSATPVDDDDLAAIEAMAWGLPVVAPGGDERIDLVEDGATGVLYRPGDARDLAAALVQLARDPAWAAALGASARRYAETRYGVDGAVDRALALYDSTLRPAHA